MSIATYKSIAQSTAKYKSIAKYKIIAKRIAILLKYCKKCFEILKVLQNVKSIAILIAKFWRVLQNFKSVAILIPKS